MLFVCFVVVSSYALEWYYPVQVNCRGILEPTPMPANNTSDVLVIGGGVIGLAIARRLAIDGVSVTLLEKDRIGLSSSWAAAGVLAAANWHRQDAMVRFQRKSLAMMPTFCETLHAVSGIDPEYVRCGSLELLFEDQKFRMAMSEVDAAAAQHDEHDEPIVQLLTPAQVQAFEPKVTGNLLGAKRCTATAQVRNSRLVPALAAAARAAGVRIHEGTEATGLCREQNRIIGARSASDIWHAGHTILCAGAWSSLLDESLRAAVDVFPVRGQVLLLAMPSLPLAHVVKHRKCYVVPRRDGLFLVGSTVEPDAGFASEATAEGVQSLSTQAIRLVPSLARATFVRAWAGLRPGTRDRRPYIGPVPGFDGLFAATGHYRTGIGLAPLTAEVVTELVRCGSSNEDLSVFLPARRLRS
ncbi:MAG: glycine oxidase ThiO [Phycisphaerae bacterium]|nr:glycine oxidase ThiO [Phycisphaerae bacterium]